MTKDVEAKSRFRPGPRRLVLSVLWSLAFVAPAEAAPSLTYKNLPTSTNTYTAVNAQAVVTNATAPYMFAITAGSLPDGLALDEETGAITGIATESFFGTFMVQVSDLSGHTATYTSFMIVSLPLLSQFDLPPGDSSFFNPSSGEAGMNLALFNEGGSPPLTLHLHYSPLLGTSGLNSAVGYNWTTEYDASLFQASDGSIVAILGDGRTATFAPSSGPQAFVGPSQFTLDFTLIPGGGYLLFDNFTKLAYTFNLSGQLTSIANADSNQLTVSRGPCGVTQVTGNAGTLTFSCSGSGSNAVLNSVTDTFGRQFMFGHTTNRLSTITYPDTSQLKFTYTINGLMNQWIDQNGNKTSVTLDSQGRILTSVDPGGNTSSATYNGSVTVVTDANSNATTFTSQDSVAPTKITDPLSGVWTRTLNSNFQPTFIVNANGSQFHLDYQPETGYPSQWTDALGNSITSTFTSRPQGPLTAFDVTKITLPNNLFINVTRDANGHPLAVDDLGGYHWTNTFTATGKIKTSANPAGGTWTFDYDNKGNLTDAVDPAGNHTTYTFNLANQLAQISLPDGTQQSTSWDSNNRLISLTNANGVMKFSWDPVGNLQSITDRLNNPFLYGYDPNNRLVSRTDPRGVATTYKYDAVGNLTGLVLPTGGTITRNFDALNRPMLVTYPSGIKFGYNYDAVGNLTSRTDGVGNTTKFSLDPNGYVDGIIYPTGGKISLSLNSVGKVESCTDPLGHMIHMSYEGRGMVDSIQVGLSSSGQQQPATFSGSTRGKASPAGISASFGYDGLGILTSRTDPNGNVWAAKNDSSGRPSSITDPLNRTTAFTFDVRNRVSGLSSSLGSAQITYDSVGNQTQRKYSDGTVLNYAYDADNRLVGGTSLSLAYDLAGNLISSNGLTLTANPLGEIGSITYASGKTVNYTYDAGGQLSKVSDWAGGSISFTHDAAGRLTSVSRSNGITTQYVYDADGRVLSIADSSSSNQGLASVTYQRDPAGNVISETRNEPQAFAPAPGVNGFSYDAAEQVSSSGYASDALGRLIQTPGGALTWNLASNLTAYNLGGQSSQFAYDALGVRTSASPSGGTAQTYVIDYATALPSVTIVKSGGVDQRYYVYSPEGALLYAIDAAGAAHHFYHFDAQGSTTFLSNDQGQVTDTYAAGPYGENPSANGTTANPFTWLGEWGVMQEGTTGLYYMRARYYDSTAARFLSRDPIPHLNPLGIDPYVYASANPIARLDPMGLQQQQLSPFLEGLKGFIEGVGNGAIVVWNALTLGTDPSVSAAAAKITREAGSLGTAMKITASVGAAATYLAGGLALAEVGGVNSIGSKPLRLSWATANRPALAARPRLRGAGQRLIEMEGQVTTAVTAVETAAPTAVTTLAQTPETLVASGQAQGTLSQAWDMWNAAWEAAGRSLSQPQMIELEQRIANQLRLPLDWMGIEEDVPLCGTREYMPPEQWLAGGWSVLSPENLDKLLEVFPWLRESETQVALQWWEAQP